MSNTFIQWRAFVGPAYLPRTSAYHFDWSALNTGAASALAFSTTLTGALVAGVTSTASVDSAASFAAAGGAWIGPNGSGQAWEYCGYSGKSATTLTGLTREPSADAEHNRTHSIGATVYQWYPLTQNDGRLHIVAELDENLCAISWFAELSGIAAPQVVFRQNHIVVVQARTAIGDSYTNLLVGFLDSSSIRDDATRVRGWSARIVSLANLLGKTRSRGVKVGDFNLALHGTASSAPVLGGAWKERDSGDYVAANPSFAADMAIDEDPDTLWIADRMVGTNNPPGVFEGFSQLFIKPRVSLNQGHRWIEIAEKDLTFDDIMVYDPDTGQGYMIDLQDIGADVDLSDESRDEYLIIAEDEATFVRDNPSHRASKIINAGAVASGWFDHVKAAGGALALKFSNSYNLQIRWGTQTTNPNHPDPWGTGGWVGSPIAAPEGGQTIRRVHNGAGVPHANDADDYEVGKNQSPGYTIASNDKVWLQVKLPGMNLSLRDDISSSDPGDGQKLYINDPSGPSTNGLPLSGTLQIGDERIAYSSKDFESVTLAASGARGASSTTAAAHSEGDAVLLIVTQGASSLTAATDALPFASSNWKHYNGTIHPAEYLWRWSMLEARTPEETNHEADYEQTLPITDGTSGTPTAVSHSPALRIKTLLIEFQKMTVDPARPRINLIELLVDPAFFDSSYWMSSGQTVEAVIERILENTGAPTGSISWSGGGAAAKGYTTDDDYAWTVAADLADFGGSYLQTARDSKIVAAPDNFWTTAGGGYTPDKSWSRSNAAAVEKITRLGGPVSQVKLAWRTADNLTSGEEVYPASEDWYGAVFEVGPLIYANSTAAQTSARKRYFLAHYPYELLVESAEGDLSVWPRQLHRLEWQLADDMQEIDRLLMVTSVEHLIEPTPAGSCALSTVVSGIQVDRESDG